MKNLNISRKLVISYIVILLLLAAGTIVSVMHLIDFRNQIQTFYDGPFMVKGSANIINTNFEKMQKAVYRSIANTDRAIEKEALDNAREAAAAINEQLPIIKQHFIGDKQIIARLEEDLEELAPMRENVLELSMANKNQEAVDYMEKNNNRVIKKAQIELTTLIDNGNAKALELITDLKDNQYQTSILLGIMGVISVVISGLFAAYITRSISAPVNELKKAAAHLVKGELSQININYESKDELGSLSKSMQNVMVILTNVIQDEIWILNAMADGNFNTQSTKEEYYVGEFQDVLQAIRRNICNLNNTLIQIEQASEQVALGAEQVSINAQSQAQGASEQAVSTEEVSTTIDVISAQIQENSRSAKLVNEKTNIVREHANKSGEQMQHMLVAMQEINESSREIKKIIKAIEEIAFQTSILSMNASVEAARAGIENKGVSVIANEVRSLAKRTSEASKGTAALIEKSLRSVANGTAIANETAESLKEVLDGVDEVHRAVEEITQASIRQSDAVRLVSENIIEISNVVQNNSAITEESAAASEELSSQAQLLKSLVDQFELKHM